MQMSEAWDWQLVKTAPKGGMVLLYFPAQKGRNPLPEMIKTDRYPVGYPRQPTHWLPLPPAPATPKDTPSNE